MPGVQMLRMTSSGTEASMSAIRLARAATDRTKLLKFAGAYHGHVDGLLADAGSGLATQGIPASPGVPAEVAASTIVIRWNDPAALDEALATHEFAAILAEPYPANMGLVAARRGLPRGAARARRRQRRAADLRRGHLGLSRRPRRRAGAARRAAGPHDHGQGHRRRAARRGLRRPARADAPDRARQGDVYQAGTLSGNPLAVAAGLASLALLHGEQPYVAPRGDDERARRGARRRGGGGRLRGRIQIATAPGLLTVFFSAEPVTDYAGAQACDLDAYAAWCRGLLARGVYAPASQFEAWFPSLAHTPEHVARTVAAATAAFAEIRA